MLLIVTPFSFLDEALYFLFSKIMHLFRCENASLIVEWNYIPYRFEENINVCRSKLRYIFKVTESHVKGRVEGQSHQLWKVEYASD